jgi:uncharacterized SAM-binding protein YcdF (DUF218 family)
MAVIRKLIFGVAKVFLLGSALLALVAVVAWFYPEKFLCVDSGPVAADVIVVLGGGVHERPVRAAELFQQHAAPRILLTGAGDDVINLSILRKKGVPLGVIERESDSLTTCENALFSIQRLRAQHVRSVILVTTWYHARRALKTFEHFAPEIKFYSRPSYYAFDRGDWSKPGNFKRMRLEFLKLPGYWLRYGVNPF